MTTTKTDLTVAIEIKRQLGNKACFMLGAKKFVGTKNSLQFRIGRNSKNINLVVITLNWKDLYDVDFYKVRGINVDIVSDVYDVYTDMLHSIIEDHTGMRTSL